MRVVQERDKATTNTRAQTLWDSFTTDEKNLVRFGMFPDAKMKVILVEGFDGREMAIALMDIADKNGGMRA